MQCCFRHLLLLDGFISADYPSRRARDWEGRTVSGHHTAYWVENLSHPLVALLSMTGPYPYRTRAGTKDEGKRLGRANIDGACES